MATNYTQWWKDLTDKRNSKLIATDWTQFADSPLSDTKKAEWATYRQALREIPNNLRASSNYVSDEETNPYDETIFTGWPTKPS